jgi:hypothetical protein
MFVFIICAQNQSARQKVKFGDAQQETTSQRFEKAAIRSVTIDRLIETVKDSFRWAPAHLCRFGATSDGLGSEAMAPARFLRTGARKFVNAASDDGALNLVNFFYNDWVHFLKCEPYPPLQATGDPVGFRHRYALYGTQRFK